jgi:hypothetical protein
MKRIIIIRPQQEEKTIFLDELTVNTPIFAVDNDGKIVGMLVERVAFPGWMIRPGNDLKAYSTRESLIKMNPNLRFYIDLKINEDVHD